MQTIGEKLEEARKRKGISIREAAESTKIRGDYLQKFEANTFEIGLPPLYLKGFVRAYARFLDLDAERIVSELASLQSEGKTSRRERDTREVYGRVDFGAPANSPESNDTPSGSRSHGGGGNDNSAMIKLGLIGGGIVLGIVIIILLVKVLFGTPEPTTRPTQTAETAPASVQAEAAQTLTFTAIEATRVKIVQDLDGVVLFNGNLARGETKSVRKQGKLLITVEIGKNLRMEVNGRNYTVPIDGYGRFALD